MLGFDVQAFRRWLLAQPEGSVVGYAVKSDCCPLACWQRQVTGMGCQVYADRYCLGDDESRLPLWATHFVLLVDQDVGVGTKVRRERALQVLERVLKAHGL